MKKYQPVIDEVTQWVSRPVGSISETVSSRDSMFGDSKFVDLIHSIQLEKTGADLSISAPLSLDATIKQGPVYVRDMFSLYPYENLLFTMEMTGREIKALLEYSYQHWFNQMKSLDDDLINFKRDAEGNLIFNTPTKPMIRDSVTNNYDSVRPVDQLRGGYHEDVHGQRISIKTMNEGWTSNWTGLQGARSTPSCQGGGGTSPPRHRWRRKHCAGSCSPPTRICATTCMKRSDQRRDRSLRGQQLAGDPESLGAARHQELLSEALYEPMIFRVPRTMAAARRPFSWTGSACIVTLSA